MNGLVLCISLIGRDDWGKKVIPNGPSFLFTAHNNAPSILPSSCRYWIMWKQGRKKYVLRQTEETWKVKVSVVPILLLLLLHSGFAAMPRARKKSCLCSNPQTISSCMSKCRERKCKKNPVAAASSLLVVRMNKLQRPINKICLEVNLSKKSRIVLKEETGSCYKTNISGRGRLLNASQSLVIIHSFTCYLKAIIIDSPDLYLIKRFISSNQN